MGEEGREAKYLYCIIHCPEERCFTGLRPIGDSAGAVHTVVFDDLACVVSDSLDTKYDCTRANMMAHETVIEQVMREFPVLPIRFGTVTRKGTEPAEEIRLKLLKGRQREFRELLHEMAGKVELGLRALWRDEKAIYQEIRAQNGAIRKLCLSLQGRSPQAAHFDRLRLGEMVKKVWEARREAEARNILTSLSPWAVGVRENKLVIDRMVLNAAFLVAKGKEEAFDERVNKLEQELGERMALKYTGPNPPSISVR